MGSLDRRIQWISEVKVFEEKKSARSSLVKLICRSSLFALEALSKALLTRSKNKSLWLKGDNKDTVIKC